MREVLQGAAGMRAYYFPPDGRNDAFFQLGHYANGCHVNSLVAAARRGEDVQVLVEVTPPLRSVYKGNAICDSGTASIQGLTPALTLDSWPSAIWEEGEAIGGAGKPPQIEVPRREIDGRRPPDRWKVYPRVSKSLRVVGVERRELGPEDDRRTAWVWVCRLERRRSGR